MQSLILQQCGLLRAGGHCHRKPCAAQLLLGTQIVYKARQDQAALAAQTVQVGAAAALQRDRHSQHHRGDLIIFLGHIDVLLACKLLNGLFGKFF